MDSFKIKIMATMETQNHSLAKLVWRELLELNYTGAAEIRQDVLASYSVDLLA